MFFRKKREETPKEKINHMLIRCGERIVILEALVLACDNYLAIAGIILASEDSKEAKENLSKIYGFSEAQSQAVIDMRMRALTKMERKKLFDEYQECRSRYEELQIAKKEKEVDSISE